MHCSGGCEVVSLTEDFACPDAGCREEQREQTKAAG